MYHFVRKRLQFRNLLKASRSGLDTGHFTRLMFIASADLAFAIPINIYVIARLMQQTLLPWHSWAEIHYDWAFVDLGPASAWMQTSQHVIDQVLPRYIAPVLAFLLFALIGATEDAMSDYVRLAKWLTGGTRRVLKIRRPQ